VTSYSLSARAPWPPRLADSLPQNGSPRPKLDGRTTSGASEVKVYNVATQKGRLHALCLPSDGKPISKFGVYRSHLRGATPFVPGCAFLVPAMTQEAHNANRSSPVSLSEDRSGGSLRSVGVLDRSGGWLPVPRKLFAKASLGQAGDAGENVGEPGSRVDVVELRGSSCT